MLKEDEDEDDDEDEDENYPPPPRYALVTPVSGGQRRRGRRGRGRLAAHPLNVKRSPLNVHRPIRNMAGILPRSGMPVRFHSRMVWVRIHSSEVVMPAAMHMRVSGRKEAHMVSNILRLR